MGRILAVDYGSKRVGIAVTDPFKIIATGLITVHSKEVIGFLKDYFNREEVECIVVGEPRRMNNEPSQSAELIEVFIKTLRKNFPGLTIERMDERFTSKMAVQAMIDGGLRRKARQNKELVDEISATIILQSYLDFISKR